MKKILFVFLTLICISIGTCSIKQEHDKKEVKDNGKLVEAKMITIKKTCSKKANRNQLRVEVNGVRSNSLAFTYEECKTAYVGKTIYVLVSPNTDLVILPRQNYSLLFAYSIGIGFYFLVPIFFWNILFPKK